MAQTFSRLIAGFLVLVLVAGTAAGEKVSDKPLARRQSTDNLAESLSINMNVSLLKLLLELRREAQFFAGELPAREVLDEHLDNMLAQASVPLQYLALADVQGDVLSSSPLYTLPEEWGIGSFPTLAKNAENLSGGSMHYVPALLDRPATLAFIFPVRNKSKGKQAEGQEVNTPRIMLALLDSQRSFGSLLEKRMFLPWESVKIWGPDGDLLFQQGDSTFNVLNSSRPNTLFLSKPAELPGERILREPSGGYQGYTFSVNPFKGLERRIYWHRSLFIGGDQWVVCNLVEKPINRGSFDAEEMTGLWTSESDMGARLVSVQSGSTWKMLISLNGQVTQAEGRILGGQLTSYSVEGVNVKTHMQNVRGRYDFNTGRIELHWLLDSGKTLGGRSMLFAPFLEEDMLPPADPNRIRFRIFQ